jgi:hypothetical protein
LLWCEKSWNVFCGTVHCRETVFIAVAQTGEPADGETPEEREECDKNSDYFISGEPMIRFDECGRSVVLLVLCNRQVMEKHRFDFFPAFTLVSRLF